MAISKIDTPALVADAVDNTILDLADNFAFTGTVSGTSTLITSQAVSGVSQITMNNMFSSAYTSYKVTGEILCSVSTRLYWRFVFPNGTVDDNGAYSYAIYGRDSNGDLRGAQNNNTSAFDINNTCVANGQNAFDFVVHNPFATGTGMESAITGSTLCERTDNANYIGATCVGNRRDPDASHTGFKIYPGSGGIITGRIIVLGLG